MQQDAPSASIWSCIARRPTAMAWIPRAAILPSRFATSQAQDRRGQVRQQRLDGGSRPGGRLADRRPDPDYAARHVAASQHMLRRRVHRAIVIPARTARPPPACQARATPGWNVGLLMAEIQLRDAEILGFAP